jgi:hypothetical protein
MIEQITKSLATTANDMEDLQRTSANWQQSVKASYSAAGELRAVVEAVFPQEAGIHLLQASLQRRQVWWAVLSALEPADVTDAEMLRHNLLGVCSGWGQNDTVR